MSGKPRGTGDLVMAWFYSTFEAWKNCRRTGSEKYYVGYSPIIGVDAERIFSDLPDAHVVHVVRNPLACYSETKYRPFPLSLRRYVWTWNIVQYKALVYRDRYPGKFTIIRYEDLISKKKEVMDTVCKTLGISFDESLMYTSWNGERLEDIYPWGTIHTADLEEQNARIKELGGEEVSEAKLISRHFATTLGYDL
jgi:hypothetical protein